MLKAQTLTHESVVHGFLTRKGGVSEGIYASLNCGPGSNDDPASVVENRQRALSVLDFGDGALLTCYQVHSADVIVVREPWDAGDPPKADAMVTDRPGLALGILTADCAPVLLAEPEAGIVGAAHAGWRGASGGVLQATVHEMIKLGANKARIHAAVGPCIHQASYEVGEEMRAEVARTNSWADWCFVRGEKPGHYHFDLPSYVSGVLQAMDIGRVEVLDFDTYADEQHFFSYRRTTHRGEPDYGRQMSVIGLAG